MVAPPVKAGGVNSIVAWPLPGVAVPMVGAPGTTAWICRLRLTCGAAFQLPSPPWLAAIVQVPTATIETVVPLTVQVEMVVEL